jgi:hypothetical protein
MKNIFNTWKQDIPAGLVVFLVAVPLCLGIALASGANPFAGLIAGITGGVVGFIFRIPQCSSYCRHHTDHLWNYKSRILVLLFSQRGCKGNARCHRITDHF